MKKPTKLWTTGDAIRLLCEGGETNPSNNRVELTRRILQICEDEGLGFAHWNERLMPKLDDLEDVELVMAIEEAFDVVINDEAYEDTPLETFGDFVCFFEEYFAFVLHRRAYDRARLTQAACATQAAFYTIRRRLCEAGAAYYKVHGLRPDVRLLDVPKKHAEPLARHLSADFGLALPLQRVLWGRIRTAAVQWAFFVASIIFCVFVSFHSPIVYSPFVLGIMLCLLMNLVFGCVVARLSCYKWPKEYQTLGDVARKIAATVPPAGAMQAAL